MSLRFLFCSVCFVVFPVEAQEPLERPALNLAIGASRGIGVTLPVGSGVRINPRVSFDRIERDSDVANGGIRQTFSQTLIGADLRILIDVGNGPLQWYWGVGGGVRLAINRQQFTGASFFGTLPSGDNESRLGGTFVASWGARIALVDQISVFGETNLNYTADQVRGGTATRFGIGTSGFGFLLYF